MKVVLVETVAKIERLKGASSNTSAVPADFSGNQINSKLTSNSINIINVSTLTEHVLLEEHLEQSKFDDAIKISYNVESNSDIILLLCEISSLVSTRDSPSMSMAELINETADSPYDYSETIVDNVQISGSEKVIKCQSGNDSAFLLSQNINSCLNSCDLSSMPAAMVSRNDFQCKESDVSFDAILAIDADANAGTGICETSEVDLRKVKSVDFEWAKLDLYKTNGITFKELFEFKICFPFDVTRVFEGYFKCRLHKIRHLVVCSS